MAFVRKNILFRCLALLLICFAQNSNAQLSEDSSISLITCRPGEEIYNAFGHTAIRIFDPINELDILYNYGMFSFDEPNFILKFLRGKLLYWLGIEKYNTFLNNYTKQKRSVIEQKLNLSLEQKNQIFLALRHNLKPDNRNYLYDFFFDNCSTRPRDIITDNIINLNFYNTNDNKSFRELIDEYTVSKPWTDFGIDLIIGSIADRKASTEDQMFLPEYLMFHIDIATIKNQKLVDENKLVLDYENEAKIRSTKSFPWPMLLFGMFLFIELLLYLKPKLLNSKLISYYDNAWFCVLGISGVLILFMWFGTDHIATKSNLNLLWLNPLYLFKLKKHKSPLLDYSIFGLLLLTILQNNTIQSLHAASIIIIAIIAFKVLRGFKLN